MPRIITKDMLVARAKAIGRRNPDHYRMWPDTAVLRELVNREWDQGDKTKLLRGVTGDLLAEANDYQLDGALFAAAVQAAHHPTNRPRRDPGAARVVKAYSVHPDSAAKIATEAQRTGESQGQVVDRLVQGLG